MGVGGRPNLLPIIYTRIRWHPPDTELGTTTNIFFFSDRELPAV